MQNYQRYLIRSCLPIMLGVIALAVGVFLLERILKIFELVSATPGASGIAMRMLFDLIPYALSLAMPIALFLGVLLSVDRLSRTGELTAMMSAGVSLFQIARPYMLCGLVTAALTLLISGVLQPLGRYDYRAHLNAVEQTSFEAAFQEGKFAQIGERTFWTEDRRGDNRLGQIFILEERPATGASRITTAPGGAIRSGLEEDETLIRLDQGQGIIVSAGREVVERLDFLSAEWTVQGEVLGFRARGEDERELVLTELWAEMGERPPGRIEPHIAGARFHFHVGRAAVVLLFPLLAIPMGLGYGRSFQSISVAIGLILLVAIQKSLESGEAWARTGAIEPWLGIWPFVGGTAAIILIIFLRAALTNAPPLLASLTAFPSRLISAFRFPRGGDSQQARA